jgi:hypothetical protein
MMTSNSFLAFLKGMMISRNFDILGRWILHSNLVAVLERICVRPVGVDCTFCGLRLAMSLRVISNVSV